MKLVLRPGGRRRRAMQVAILGVNILLFMLVWKYMYQKSILDRKRDHLFDLREDVREYFLTNNISLSEPVYKNIRDVLNRHIKVLDRTNFSRIFVYSNLMERNPELSEYMAEQINKRFETKNNNLKKFIKEIRAKATLCVTSYLIESSLIMLVVAALIFPGVLVGHAINAIRKKYFPKSKKAGPSKFAVISTKKSNLESKKGMLLTGWVESNPNSFVQFFTKSSVEVRMQLIKQENLEKYSFRKAAQMRQDNLVPA
jgi:hypothetical protein